MIWWFFAHIKWEVLRSYSYVSKINTIMIGQASIACSILKSQSLRGFQLRRTNSISLLRGKIFSPLLDHKPSCSQVEAKLLGSIICTLPTVKNPRSLPGDCNIKDYISAHVTPYDGDSLFLAQPTARTLKAWKHCEELIEVERKRGILDVDSKIASTITSHKPGYVLSKEEDIIVGIQTDEPLKRACKPRGGFQVVLDALNSYGYQPDPLMAKIYSEVCCQVCPIWVLFLSLSLRSSIFYSFHSFCDRMCKRTTILSSVCTQRTRERLATQIS